MRVEELAKSLDHTVLQPGLTTADVEAACEVARDLHVAALCSYPTFVPLMVERLRGTDVKVCAVVSFPHGLDLTESKLSAATDAVEAGAEEIDVVINVSAMLSGHPTQARDDLARIVRAVRLRTGMAGRGGVLVKAIVEAPLLGEQLTRLACKIVADTGCDFAKTCTGIGTAATVHDVEVMRDALPARVGIKAAGGIRTLHDTLAMIDAGATRIGTSAAPAIIEELASGRAA
jgi:deoxyribose-phosphate aldolase